MKAAWTTSFLALLPALAPAEDGVAILRRTDAKTGVVWDLPAFAAEFPSPSDAGGARATLYQKWLLGGSATGGTLVDQKLAGANFPSIQLHIRTLDPDSAAPRTRVDQPFKVEIEISGLLSGLDLPAASSRLLLERHLVSATDPAAANPLISAPHSSAYLCDNGKTALSFPASLLTANDPTQARGEEVFAIHTLTGSGKLPTQLAAARVQVLPVASGGIEGIRNGDELPSGGIPDLTLHLKDLYPESDTHLLLFDGRQINGNAPTVIATCPVHSDTCQDREVPVRDLAAKMKSEGLHTLALVSDTIFGRELLCDPVTFRTLPPATAAAQATELARSSPSPDGP